VPWVVKFTSAPAGENYLTGLPAESGREADALHFPTLEAAQHCARDVSKTGWSTFTELKR